MQDQIIVSIPNKRTSTAANYLSIPPKHGVYVLLDMLGNPIYVGRSSNIKSRVAQHVRGNSNLPDISEELEYIEYYVCDLGVTSHYLEVYLIDKLRPKLNKEFVYKNNPQNPKIKGINLLKSAHELSQFATINDMDKIIGIFLKYNKSYLSKNQVEVLYCLSRYSAKIIGVSFLKTDTIVSSLRENGTVMSRRTVERAIKKLELLGILSIRGTQRKMGGKGANVYVINSSYARGYKGDAV